MQMEKAGAGRRFLAILIDWTMCSVIASFLGFESKAFSTLAIFFIVFNLIRICQFSLQGTLTPDIFFKLWWIAAPLAISIHLGHRVHKKISESNFKKIVALLATFSGIEFLFKK